MECVVKTEETG